jgi:predicted ribosome quality control (RQC) complex YloA/Tae2 family protein
MQIPNISLAYLVAELKPLLDGSVLRKIQELPNGWLKLKIQTRQGTKDLIATPDSLFLTSYSMPARQQTSGFGAFLRKQLSNKHLEKVEQHGFDRIVIMEFQDFFLIFELFAKGNVILTDSSLKILSAFRKEQWKDRTLRKEEQYKFPSSKGLNPLELDKKSLGKLLQESGKSLVPALVKTVNIAPILAEEACFQTGLEKEKPAKELAAKEIASLTKAIKALYLVKPEKSKPVLLESWGKKTLLPFSLSAPFEALQEFPSINEALDRHYSGSFQSKKEQLQTSAISKRKAELQHSMQQQKDALERLQLRVGQNAQKAELIYKNYSQLFELLQAFQGLKGQKMQEKEIMYKLKSRFPFLKELSLKGRKLVVSLPD